MAVDTGFESAIINRRARADDETEQCDTSLVRASDGRPGLYFWLPFFGTFGRWLARSSAAPSARSSRRSIIVEAMAAVFLPLDNESIDVVCVDGARVGVHAYFSDQRKCVVRHPRENRGHDAMMFARGRQAAE